MSELYALPKGWEYSYLEKLVHKMHQGVNTAADKVKFHSGGYPIIQTRNITSGKLHFDNVKYVNDNDWNLYQNKYKPKVNNILLSNIGTIGKSVIITENVDFLIHWNIFLIDPISELVNVKYLKYFFDKLDSDSYYDQFLRGATVKFVSKKNLSTTKVPFSTLQEQKRIVSKLDTLFEKIDKAITLHQKNMDEADMFMGSVLNEVFGELEDKSKVSKLKDIYDLKTGGTPSRNKDEYWDNGTIKWLSSKDINQIEIYDCDGRITEEGFNSSNTKIIEKDSVLIALNGQGKTRGSVAMLRTEATLNQSLVAMIPKDRKTNQSEYLFRNLQMRYIEIRKMTGLNERRGLNMKLIGNIEVPIPSLLIQQKAVKYLDQISEKTEKLKSVQKEKMQSLKALKASLLDRAFRGEL